MHTNESAENYLETILILSKSHPVVRSVDVAAELGFKKSSVSVAMKKLRETDQITVSPEGYLYLTESGLATAEKIYERHLFLSEWLEKLGVNPVIAASDACKIEHVIGETVLSRFVALIDAISDREDCAPLREYLASTMPKICPDETEELISLDQLPKDKSAVVVKVAEGLRGLKKFADLGLVPGTLLQFEGRAPFGDLLRIKVMGSSLSLRAGDAQYIWVKLAD